MNADGRDGITGAVLAALVVVALVAGGCSPTPDQSPGAGDNPTSGGAVFGRQSQRVYQVNPGPAETDTHLGWITVERVEQNGNTEEITYVRDLKTDILGFFLRSSGATYRFVERIGGETEKVKLGNHGDRRSLQLLYDIPSGVFRYASEL